MPIRLIIADDHALFRQGLRSLLLIQGDIEVAAEADSAAELTKLSLTSYDILLLDLQMERWSIDYIPELSRQTTVIVLTATESIETGVTALRLGARAVVYKRCAIETLVTAIRAVAEGQVWLPPDLQAALVLQDNSVPKRLTARESDIVRLVAMGMRNAEVAERLSLSENTVKTHLTNIFHKLAIRDRLELVRYAIRAGLVSVRDN
jgi:DNA-binding NarL/FixJ family response regulator